MTCAICGLGEPDCKLQRLRDPWQESKHRWHEERDQNKRVAAERRNDPAAWDAVTAALAGSAKALADLAMMDAPPAPPMLTMPGVGEWIMESLEAKHVMAHMFFQAMRDFPAPRPERWRYDKQ